VRTRLAVKSHLEWSLEEPAGICRLLHFIHATQVGNIVSSVFAPVVVKQSKSFLLIDCIPIGIDLMQRNFERMRRQVESRQRCKLTEVTAKEVIYEAFVEVTYEAPKKIARTVHDLLLGPKYKEFRSRTIWSLSKAFTSTSKEVAPIPRSRRRQSWESSWRPGSRGGSD
jgi:hypothetical protein